ncbi:hypothetical protein [Paenibacillus pabuli]|uniref:hypothetical protein n=1 Tax=Paenibacillus pabuli TaxID=1472 RepID=UPI001FFEA323|nr:hypothetical protein [Paenibacillus pabuli]UPK42510.1 hypothetical protein KET34_25475 [Paenibacillus pabuli]
MRKYIVTYLAIMTLLSGCSMFDKYEGYMKDAKNSMRAGNYKESIEILNDALIEEPNSKDAATLKIMAEEALYKENSDEEAKQFISDTSPIYLQLLSLTEEINEDASNVLVGGAEHLLEDLQLIENEMKMISVKWNSSKDYSGKFEYLSEAIEDLRLCLTAIVEDISEPLELNGDHSRSNIVTKTILSNDSGIRARLSFHDYRSKMDSFKTFLPSQ